MRSTREVRKMRLMKQAEELVDELLDWSDSTPEPNLTQIEGIVLRLRKRFGEEMARDVIEVQEAKQPAVGPACPKCGGEMRYKGQKEVCPQSWVGELLIERGYYYCEQCRVGLFPPG
jgi:C4-type Zn-finger protein